MSCFHPLKAFQIGFHDSGKPKYKVCSYDVNSVFKCGDSWFASPEDHPSSMEFVKDYIEIPCGKCVGCRLDYSREWANRCMLELQYHEQSCFLTLTYDEDHVPVSFYGDPETGEVQEAYTLKARDLQLFMKRLREFYSDQKIRFFACGEYGGKTFRPHYHLILFGFNPNDLKPLKKSELGDWYYTSEQISKLWPYGYHLIGDVTWESCAYVARYIMKKQKGETAVVYQYFNIEPEFVRMSRKPGIGMQYYLDNADEILHNYNINIATEKGGREFRPPRYYDRLFDIDYPEEMQKIRLSKRKIAELNHQNLLRQIDIDYQEYLQLKEDNLISRTKILDQKRGEL